MGNTQFTNDLWTRFVLDRQMVVHEIVNPDDRLFFGKRPVVGSSLAKAAGEENRLQVQKITDSVSRARQQKRNACFQYLSAYAPGISTYVCVHVQYRNDGSFCLYLTALDMDDLRQARADSEQESNTLLEAVYENLPIGLEIYDSGGRLVEINAYKLRILGVSDKKEELGKNLFMNSYLPDQAKTLLMKGENAYFTVDYLPDTEKESKNIRHFEMSVSVMRTAEGAIDKYFVISQDITGRVRLKKEYEDLYTQNRTILDSLPVGIGLYAANGTILYSNERFCRIFGIDKEEIKKHPVKVNDSIVPQEIKDAVRDAVPLHMLFPHNFHADAEKECCASVHKETRQIECKGTPVLNAAGKMESYVFIMDDVTEAENNKEMLRQSRKKAEMAMKAADIMLWEFDVTVKMFFCDNEPMNDYDRSKPLTIELYIQSMHPEDREKGINIVQKMLAGEEFSFEFDSRVLFPGISEWQYCTISGSPYEHDKKGKVVRYVGTRKNDTVLQRKKHLQDKILNSIPLPIHIKDVEDNFRYVFCNEESKRMFGTSEDKTTYDVMDAEEVERIQKTDLEVFKTGRPYLGVERIVLKDGRSYDTIVRKSVIYDEGKRLLINTRWDQSLQNDLMRRAKLLSLTMEAMNAFTWFFEPEKNRLSFGEGFDKTGKKASEVNSFEKFFACIHPDDRHIFTESFAEVIVKDSGIWDAEYRIDFDGDGNYKWWQGRGMLETATLNDAPYKYIFGMTICIESHKQSELTLLRNKEELNHLIRQNELVLNNTNSGLAYITPDYIVQWENISKCSASLSYEAYKQGEFCYKSAHNRTAPCENCVLQRALQSCQMEQIKFQLDNNHVVEIFATPVFGRNDSVDGIVIRVDDVTEREQIIAELKQAKTQAEQSDKLKSAFLANMSHEIRTPLNAIVGFSELLMTSAEDDREEYMRIISDNNELLLKLISDILDLSKIEAGSVELKYEKFDLSEYFNGIAASMQQRVTNPAVRLTVANPYPYCYVALDRNRIAQILSNYVTNAIKYTPKGTIEMGYECDADGIRLYVKDTGIGIAGDKKDKVFHRFEKLDEFAQGTGLGLSICKAIAESMGGSVGFESRYGEGSLFWAKLPCDPNTGTAATDFEEETPRTDAVDPAGGKCEGARKVILVAEDNPSNYLLVSAMLRKKYELVKASNGLEALELVRSNHFDLLLMDMKMPVMDGMTATAEIRKFDTRLPIVALTAHAFESDRKAALAAGCDEYLVKPIDSSKLMAVLRKYFPEPGVPK